jgi:hypothetical protein
MNNLKEKIKNFAPVALLISLNVFLFAPAAVYIQNINEFPFGLIELLLPFVIPLIITLLFFVFLVLIIPKCKIHYYVSTLLAVGILFWFKGSFLNWNYGVFNGILIDWGNYQLQGWLDIGIWIIVLAAALKWSKRICCISDFVSIGLIVGQCIILIVSGFQLGHDFWLKEYNFSSKYPESLSSYSKNINVVHVLFDAFQTDVFLEIIKEESLGNKFDGFTVYKGNMANAPITSLSVPSIFSGEVYDGSISQSDYYQESTGKKGFQKYLHDLGYVVNLVPDLSFPKGSYTTQYKVPYSYGGTIENEHILNSSHLFEVALFRYSPQFIKKSIYNENKWLISSMLSVPPTKIIVSQIKFFKDYTENIIKETDKPTYHFLHLVMPHPPYSIDKDGTYHEGLDQRDRNSYKNQAKYCVKLFVHYLDKLKQEGLYDSALIILNGDHGSEFAPIIDGKPVAMKYGKVPALLAIKPPDKNGQMTISDAQTQLSDIPSTIMDVLNLDKKYPGVSILSEENFHERKRKFVVPSNGEQISQSVVAGSIFEVGSWIKAEDILIVKSVNYYKWGDAINFGMLGNADKYKRKGWSYPHDDHELNNGKETSLVMQIDPPKGDIELTASFRPILHLPEVPRQRINVRVNGHEVGKWTISQPGQQSKSVLIPRKLMSSDKLEIVFELPDSICPKDLGIGLDERTYGLAMFGINMFSLDSLFDGKSYIDLYSGQDHYLTKDALKGVRSGGVQYAAVMQANGLVVQKISTPGIIVISNASGEYKKHVFNEPAKGIAFLSDLSNEGTVFAAGLHIPSGMLSKLFSIDEARGYGNKLNFTFARVASQSRSKIGEEDVNLSYAMATGVISSIGDKLENPATASVDGLNGVTLPKFGSVIPVTGASFSIAGFAIDKIHESPAAGVIIVVDGQTYIADYGGERPDIAAALKNPNYLKSQFYALIPTEGLANGLHDVSLRVIAADRSGYFASEWSAKISIAKKD